MSADQFGGLIRLNRALFQLEATQDEIGHMVAHAHNPVITAVIAVMTAAIIAAVFAVTMRRTAMLITLH